MDQATKLGLGFCKPHTRPRGYKTRVHSQTQNKAQWLAACGHVSASSQSLRFILSLRLCSSFITSRPGHLWLEGPQPIPEDFCLSLGPEVIRWGFYTYKVIYIFRWQLVYNVEHSTCHSLKPTYMKIWWFEEVIKTCYMININESQCPLLFFSSLFVLDIVQKFHARGQ